MSHLPTPVGCCIATGWNRYKMTKGQNSPQLRRIVITTNALVLRILLGSVVCSGYRLLHNPKALKMHDDYLRVVVQSNRWDIAKKKTTLTATTIPTYSYDQ